MGLLGEIWPPGFPSIIDWASGQNGMLGTPTPSGAAGRTQAEVFEEHSDSPEVERAEQATVVHRFSTDYDSGVLWLKTLGRGSILEDSEGDNSFVLANKLQRKPGGMAELTVTAEGINFDLPPDEFEVMPVEINPPIFYHPRYRSVITYNLDEDGNYNGPTFMGAPSELSGFQIIQRLKNATQLQQIEAQEMDVGDLNPTEISDPLVLGLVDELLAKLRKGEDEFYLAAWKVVMSRYFFMNQRLDPGGYVQDPVLSGELPYYFWSVDRYNATSNPFTDNVFLFALDTNPDIYDPDLGSQAISWFRFADQVSYQRTWFKITKTWVAAPLGTWDIDIYPNYDA